MKHAIPQCDHQMAVLDLLLPVAVLLPPEHVPALQNLKEL